MAELAAGFLGPALEVVKWVSAPILRQFQYLCCFTANITALKNEAHELEVTERDLQGKVDAARNGVRVISGEVESWLEKSKLIKDETDVITNEALNVEAGCLKLGARFSLSKRAKKTTDRLKELRGQCKLDTDDISQSPPAAATQTIPSGLTNEFESRKQIEEDIMTTLRDGDVNMMGIHGMGGLGKTTMAIKIMNRALKENVFKEVVMAVVSQPIDKLKIQLEISRSLGLKLEEESSQARMQKLHSRLRGTKRILLVLDDIWERLVLEDIGIPSDYKECTILLTSRDHHVLIEMDVQKLFGMDVLSGEDPWIMFRKRVGTCVDDTKLNCIAKQVVNECKGLPLALTTVGAALKGEVNVDKWKNAVRQLEKGDPDIPGFTEKVYNPLKLSYDVLEPKYQYVFLLCCLYPEDADIPLEHLTYFCIGLRIFDEGNVEDARNRMHALTKVLISRSLLLDSNRGDDHVRMHDVVRDVCIFIAKQKGNIGNNDSSRTSSLQRYELPSRLELLRISDSEDKELKLRLLYSEAHKNLRDEFTLDNRYLEGNKDLSVICIENYKLVSLPNTAQMLRSLNTLILDWCSKVKTLSIVGELLNLEILIIRWCDSFRELPMEIKGLNRLKVLDLTGCTKLQRIGRDIISSLLGLEELKMLMSFKKWKGENRQGRDNYARLRELEALTKLKCLEIEIDNPALAAENICLSSKVDRFNIAFEFPNAFSQKYLRGTYVFGGYLSTKKISLNLNPKDDLGHWIEKQLLSNTEYLVLTGNGANNVDMTKLENIKMLKLSRCESMKNVVTTSMDDGGCANVFPSLEHLNLLELPKLEEIWDHRVWLNCFRNLKHLKLFDLPALKQLWKISQYDLGKDFLPQLEVLDIYRCEMMEGVFLWNGNDNNSCHNTTIRFPKLESLELAKLSNLVSLCEGIEGIEFPLLRKLNIRKCSKMKGLIGNKMRSGNENPSTDINNNFFCESQQISFGCLERLEIDQNPFCSHTIHVSRFYGLEELSIKKCTGRSLFTSSMVENLVNLRKLGIGEADEMVEVIKDDEEKGMSAAAQRLFPKLQEFYLWDLPQLVSFCGWKCDVELPSLRELNIFRCPNMENFTLGSLAAPSLVSFSLGGPNLGVVKDVNELVKQRYFNRMEEKKQAEEAEQKKKGGEEEQEKSAEIEEEQNDISSII